MKLLAVVNFLSPFITEFAKINKVLEPYQVRIYSNILLPFQIIISHFDFSATFIFSPRYILRYVSRSQVDINIHLGA
jgi:hypothetical protein